MDNVLFKKLTLCAANPRSRKATISSFFKSLALRFSFSVCRRTCLFFRLLLRFGELVVLRVASVTLYEAGDADILGECSSSLRGSAHGAFFKRKKCQKLFRVFLLSFFKRPAPFLWLFFLGCVTHLCQMIVAPIT